jgi:signal transduction histidine kinase
MQAFFLSEISYAEVPVNEAFLYAMRSTLMNLRLSEELSRARAEKLGDGELAADLRAMRREIFRSTRLLDNVAVVRGAAAGGLKANASVLDLAALCRTLIESISLLRPDTAIRLNAEGELCLLGDRVLITQMILNLISNCLVHAEGLSRITLSVVPTPTQLILSVGDDGCGIAEDAMGGVFERYRESFALGSVSGGAGLGLSVVRSVARLHGGTLMIESRAGSGTSARVSLSRRIGAAALSSPEPEGPADMGALLAGLADCLSPECFDEKYLD